MSWLGMGAHARCFLRLKGDVTTVTNMQLARMQDLEAEHSMLPKTDVGALVEAQSVFADF